jgi:hypothetical protein
VLEASAGAPTSSAPRPALAQYPQQGAAAAAALHPHTKRPLPDLSPVLSPRALQQGERASHLPLLSSSTNLKTCIGFGFILASVLVSVSVASHSHLYLCWSYTRSFPLQDTPAASSHGLVVLSLNSAQLVGLHSGEISSSSSEIEMALSSELCGCGGDKNEIRDGSRSGDGGLGDGCLGEEDGERMAESSGEWDLRDAPREPRELSSLVLYARVGFGRDDSPGNGGETSNACLMLAIRHGHRGSAKIVEKALKATMRPM